MPTSLGDIATRIANPSPFLRAMLEDLRDRILPILKENTPGETLWDEWDSQIRVSQHEAAMMIFNRRLEGDRTHWEPIFGYLNHGTRTHWIEPVNAQALRWEDEFGDVHFSKGHFVSGILPAFFAEQAEREIADFEKTLERKWSTWVNTGRYMN